MTPEPTFEALSYERRGAVALITLNRPDVRNALDRTLRSELRSAMEAAVADPAVGAIVLTGAGPAFCAGQNLREVVDAHGPDGGLDFEQTVRDEYIPLVRAIAAADKPTIAAINGSAAGAGLSIALCCDLRIAADDASLVAAFGRIGLVPDTGMSWLLPRLVGPARAAEILLLGTPVAARDAERIGLVNRVVPAEALVDEAVALGAQLAEASPLAVALTKRQLRAALELPLEATLELEARHMGIAGRSPEHAEGLAAFREKRRPRFRQG